MRLAIPGPNVELSEAQWSSMTLFRCDLLYRAGTAASTLRAGRDNVSMAMHCPGAIGNPFLHLRLGQCQFELGNLDRAADELARAYMGTGIEIFEDEEGKYFEFLKTRLQPPPGGW